MKIKTFMINYWWLILVSAILLIVIAFTIGKIRMEKRIASEVEELMAKKTDLNDVSSIIEAEDLEMLPPVVKNWLTSVGVVGQERVQFIEFLQRGKMKLDPNQEEWINAKAKQHVRIKEPAFLWHVDLPMLPVINTKGRDYFINGEASMQVYIGSLIPVVNVKNNEKTDESSLSRFLLELPLYPTAALEEYVTWEGINETSAKAIMSYKGMTVEAIFHFNNEGMLKKIEALRYKENDEKAKRIPCIGEIKAYETFDGMKIPSKIDITWLLNDQEYTWYKLEIYDYKTK